MHMRLDRRRLILILLAVFVITATVIIAQKQENKSEFVVDDFRVEDVPADDGSGLMLSWKPLNKSKRIIEYRVYRGTSPDQLFFLESIQVNPKSGVASDRMYFYDNSGSELVEISAPAKLRKEKQQAASSPLYRKPPRDLKFAASVMDKFSLLSLLDRSQYYFRSKEVAGLADEEGNAPSYAGLRANQQTVMAFLKPGETYYYTVLAVNERQRLLPMAEIKSGSPVPNAPDPASALYSVVMEDTQELMFQWDYPLYKDDVAQYRIHRVANVPDSIWSAMAQTPGLIQAQSQVITQGAVGSGVLKNYTSVKVGEGITAFKDARFTLELMDYDGFSSFSPLSTPRLATKADLPPKTDFYIEDKPNDKGDRLTVVWDQPIVFVVKTSLLNKDNTKIRVNYQLNKTETQKVKNIWFEFLDPVTGTQVAKIKEFYLDNSIVLNLKSGYDFKKGFRVRITMDGKPEIPADYVLEQDLDFDPTMLTLMPGKALYRNGLDVSRIFNTVYRRVMQSPAWRLVKNNTSFDNNLDVTIPYPSLLQKQVQGISYAEGDSLILMTYGAEGVERKARKLQKGDVKTPVALLPHEIDFMWDKDSETLIRTSLFAAPAKKMLDEAIKAAEDKLKELKEQKTSLSDPEQITMIDEQIAKAEKKLAAYNANDKLKDAFAGSNRSRIRKVVREFEDFSRHQTYQVVKTDNKGMFVEFDPMMQEGEIQFFKPISNWFDRNKFVTLFASILFCLSVVVFVSLAKRGKDLYIRPIAGLAEIDNAIGRATEMGRPILYCMGNGSISDVATIASMGILGLVARRAAEYDTRLIVPCYDFIVMPIAQEIVREAHYAVGRPDTFDRNNVFYLTNVQFAYVAGVNGIMIRERMATNFFMGLFAAEALLMTETGNAVGAVQIAGTDAVTQIPFFITTCDYTLIGEELYAASAYLNREPMLLGTLKAQDYFKFVILSVVIVGAILASFQITGLTLLLPLK